MFDLGKPQEECGVFGIYGNGETDVVMSTYLALNALQHRGQRSCGIAAGEGPSISLYKDLGLVIDVFNKDVLEGFGQFRTAVGHVSYGFKDRLNHEEVQPLVSKYIKGAIAIAGNTNLTNGERLRKSLVEGGAIFQSDSDVEVIAYIVAKERANCSSLEEAVLSAMDKLEGAYSLVLMTGKKLIAVRDPVGLKPLCMGESGKTVAFASESCALAAAGISLVRDVEPGEVVMVNDTGVHSLRHKESSAKCLCSFEFIYFARPDSVMEGASINLARQEAGRYLAEEHPAQADIVVGVPDSGIDAALGYSKQSGIPFEVGFIKNRNIRKKYGRIDPADREKDIRLRFNAIASVVKGKRVVLVDDSIVRGTAIRLLVSMLREAGASEVHVRISSPPLANRCCFRTDTDSDDSLIAGRLSVGEICTAIGADSLGYISVESLRRAPVGAKIGFCTGCFTSEYPYSF